MGDWRLACCAARAEPCPGGLAAGRSRYAPGSKVKSASTFAKASEDVSRCRRSKARSATRLGGSLALAALPRVSSASRRPMSQGAPRRPTFQALRRRSKVSPLVKSASTFAKASEDVSRGRRSKARSARRLGRSLSLHGFPGLRLSAAICGHLRIREEPSAVRSKSVLIRVHPWPSKNCDS